VWKLSLKGKAKKTNLTIMLKTVQLEGEVETVKLTTRKVQIFQPRKVVAVIFYDFVKY
jgi:hypothetical protein